VTASAESVATPVNPPRSAVPGANEESREPDAAALPAPEAMDDRDEHDDRSRGAPPTRVPARPVPTTPAPEPAPPEPADPEMTIDRPLATPAEPKAPSPPEPRTVPRGDEKPAATPETKPSKPKRPQDEDLFDDSSARDKVRRRISIAAAPEPSGAPATQRVQPTAHDDAGWVPRRNTRSVPRVTFDPQAETARINDQAR
jgi:hypothetical protein